MSKEKKKQAQIVEPLTRRTNDSINLILLKELDVKVINPSNIINGCTVIDNGNVLFSEVNSCQTKVVCMTLRDRNDDYMRTVDTLNSSDGSCYDITSIDENTIAVSIGSCIKIITINTHTILQTIKNGYRVCHGCTHCDGKLYYCSYLEGNRLFDLKTKTNQLLVPTLIGKFGYVSCDRNKLVYTSSTETVACCDMNGKEIWRFQDTSVLRSPRGVVVNNEGFVFVAGEQSRNIVVISPDGNSAKEVYRISSPTAMCYDKNGDALLVCHGKNKASWFQISVNFKI
jgi:hypothetical protein